MDRLALGIRAEATDAKLEGRARRYSLHISRVQTSWPNLCASGTELRRTCCRWLRQKSVHIWRAILCQLGTELSGVKFVRARLRVRVIRGGERT